MKLFEVDMHKIFRHFGDQKLVYKVFNCYVFVIGLHLYNKLSIIIFLCFENIKFCFEYWFLLYFLTYFLYFYENENHCLISLFLNELANFITKQPVCSWRQTRAVQKLFMYNDNRLKKRHDLSVNGGLNLPLCTIVWKLLLSLLLNK